MTISFVTENLAVGNRHVSNEELEAAGITHVLRLCHTTPKYTRTDKFVMLHPSVDNGKDKGDEYWRFIMSYGPGILQFPGRKLYVHCKAGINRGPSAVYAILRVLGYGRKEAWSLIKKARPNAGTKWWSRPSFLPWSGIKSNNVKKYLTEIEDIIMRDPDLWKKCECS